MQVEMTELEELEIIYCDMHKDVYGVKARWYRAKDVEQARRDIDQLSQELDAKIEADRRAEQMAILAFEELAKSFGTDLDTFKRWQHQAYGTRGDDEYLEHRLGLPYGYFKKKGI